MGTPTLFVIDPKGRIRYSRRAVPDQKVVDEVLQKLIQEAEADGK
jgi:peroxiredoxin